MPGDFNTCVSSNAAAANCSSRWLTEEVFKLIDIVQGDEAIYNPRHKYYFCRPYVENFWREVDLKLEKNPGTSLAKWTNLRISFRREYTNYLEEKVPPCWSYFDRMYFLHPFLRKKHQHHKSLDTQVQDALAHLSNLSNRMQRERAAICPTENSAQINTTNTTSNSPQQPLDNYLEYFDEHEHNNSELEEMMDEEQRTRFQTALDSDIKSECEENVDEYEHDARYAQEPNSPHLHMHDREEDVQEQEDNQSHKMSYDAVTALSPSSSALLASTSSDKRYSQQQHRHQPQNRLQLRPYQDEVRAKRPRTHDVQSSTASSSGAISLQMHSNISFVRPTFAKPVDMVTTTTSSGSVSTQHEADMSSASPVAPSSTSFLTHSQRHIPPYLQQQRVETVNTPATSGNTVPTGTGSLTSTQPTHAELCDCKTDPDAMFLMSLLPDIQKLNGRDRGKIKIAFQNILQDYLYPD